MGERGPPEAVEGVHPEIASYKTYPPPPNLPYNPSHRSDGNRSGPGFGRAAVASPCGVVNHRHVRARDRSAWAAGNAIGAEAQNPCGKSRGRTFFKGASVTGRKRDRHRATVCGSRYI